MKNLGKLPKNARLVTADATSMYTNINTDHGVATLRGFLEELESNESLSPDFNIEMIIEAAMLMVHGNIFEYGNAYFRQLIGTAMGTPSAVLWAIIYYY